MKFNINSEYQDKAGIYQITSLIDDRKYIGSTINLWVRCNNHRNTLINSKHHSDHLISFVNKYGIDKIRFDLIEIVDDISLLLEREQYYLDMLKPFGKYGFNTNVSSTNRIGVKCKASTKEKISAALKGKIPHNKGTKMTLTQKAKLSKAKKGRKLSPDVKKTRLEKMLESGYKPANFGVPMTESQKEKLRVHNLGKKQSTETKEKISKSLLGNKRNVKPVIQYDLSGIFIKEFESVTHASKEVGTSRGNIVFCLNETCKTAANFKWKYK